MNPISANKIKELRKLQQKKYRTESGLFIVEGQKMVEEAQKSNFKIVETYRIEEIGANAMSRISSLSTPSPILAVVEQKNHSKEEIELAAPASGRALYLGLCGVRDPGNLGTIIRIADWFGADALFCSEDCVELYNSKTIQATMGAIFRRRIVYTSIPDVISKSSCPKARWCCLATNLTASLHKWRACLERTRNCSFHPTLQMRKPANL